ncbi:MAG: DUF3536 domain-containing protein [Acidimicrobiales bacterium]
MTAYVCVHGHAYQPPRESPETGEVPVQPSAAPFHDWNERITSECYGPLGAAKMLDDHGHVVSTSNLWAEMSFDLGPTLGVWLDRHAPEVAQAVSAGAHAGAGAMAHPWVHAILPLTPAGDRATIVRWGVDEYRSRFGHSPKGMWLPETAVDSASLEALLDVGITWTMLAPHQVRVDGAEPGHVPLLVALPSGRTIGVVPYDGELSHGVAFGGLLDDGLKFAQTVVDRARAAAEDERDPLVVLSTDIESFGHHHRFGEMALAKAAHEWRVAHDIELITPDRYLERHPATRRGTLVERTSWSCAHGVERWRSDCGCRFEEVEGRDQRWRRPLRDVLDAVADVCGRLLNDRAGAEFDDPWAARYDYGVVLGARPEHRETVRSHFLGKHLVPGASEERAWAWMEAERLRLEAWSSCAWFFDSPDRIETVQVLDEARAALARYAELTGTDTVAWFDAQLKASALVG